jgi:hypothetical protein
LSMIESLVECFFCCMCLPWACSACAVFHYSELQGILVMCSGGEGWL